MEMNPLTHSFTPATSPSQVDGIRHSGAGGPTMAWCLVCKASTETRRKVTGMVTERVTERVIEQVGGQSNSRPRPVVVGGRRSPAGWNPSQQGDALRADTVSPEILCDTHHRESNDDPHPPSPRAAPPKQQALRNVTASALNPPRGPLARHQCRDAGCYFWALSQAERRC